MENRQGKQIFVCCEFTADLVTEELLERLSCSDIFGLNFRVEVSKALQLRNSPRQLSVHTIL